MCNNLIIMEAEYVLHPAIYVFVSIICALSFNTNNPIWFKIVGCILFTPIGAYFILQKTGKKNDQREMITHYICERCKLEFTQEEEFCPICLKDGNKTKLIPRAMKAI